MPITVGSVVLEAATAVLVEGALEDEGIQLDALLHELGVLFQRCLGKVGQSPRLSCSPKGARRA